jgi:hypothetical protein
MDSSAIYISASSSLIAERNLHVAAHEQHAFLTDLVPSLMKWKWCDSVTGEIIAPAFDEPPKLPDLSRWMPSDSKETWDDLPRGEIDKIDPKHWNRMADSVLVYQFG